MCLHTCTQLFSIPRAHKWANILHYRDIRFNLLSAHKWAHSLSNHVLTSEHTVCTTIASGVSYQVLTSEHTACTTISYGFPSMCSPVSTLFALSQVSTHFVLPCAHKWAHSLYYHIIWFFLPCAHKWAHSFRYRYSTSLSPCAHQWTQFSFPYNTVFSYHVPPSEHTVSPTVIARFFYHVPTSEPTVFLPL